MQWVQHVGLPSGLNAFLQRRGPKLSTSIRCPPSPLQAHQDELTDAAVDARTVLVSHHLISLYSLLLCHTNSHNFLFFKSTVLSDIFLLKVKILLVIINNSYTIIVFLFSCVSNFLLLDRYFLFICYVWNFAMKVLCDLMFRTVECFVILFINK